MFNSTFFKFLITFVIIICASFLIMGIAASFDSKTDSNNNSQAVILK